MASSSAAAKAPIAQGIVSSPPLTHSPSAHTTATVIHAQNANDTDRSLAKSNDSSTA